MGRSSNNLVGIFNILAFLLSIPILAGAIWLLRETNTECERFLQKPLIALKVFLMVVSLAGIIGAYCRVSCLLWFYLLVMFLLIVLLFCFTIFAFVLTNKGAGEVVSERGYKEYRLGDYSNWLQKRVNSQKNWNRIKICLQGSKVCQSLIDDGPNTPADTFYKEHLSALESGCCKPSNDCNFTYVTPTNWTKIATTSTNPDCVAWDNDPSILCYNCQSCKAGLLDNIKSEWKEVAVLDIIFLVCLIVVYSKGCCAFQNNRKDNA